jgi:hypothetical protein
MSGIIGGRKPKAPVKMTPTEVQTTKTQDIAQDVQAAKKKKKPGQSSLIETTSMGLGGDAPTYKPTLLS